MKKEIAAAAGADVPDTQEQVTSTESKCPVAHVPRKFHTNTDWWPNQVNLNLLHQHSPLSDPMGKQFNYAEEFNSLALNVVIKDLNPLLPNSRVWGPAVFGTYAP